jgi:hypothetical protein
MGFWVRPNRFALALATGSAVGADVFALHECDNPSQWGRFTLTQPETVKSVVAQAKTGTNQRSQDARFGNPLFGGSVCINNVGTKIAVTIGANVHNSSGSTHV